MVSAKNPLTEILNRYHRSLACRYGLEVLFDPEFKTASGSTFHKWMRRAYPLSTMDYFDSSIYRFVDGSLLLFISESTGIRFKQDSKSNWIVLK